MNHLLARYAMVALSIAGSAILLFSCGEADDAAATAANEKVMSEFSENLSVVMSQNGRRSYFFTTPLREGYTLGREPYHEFRKGVKITTYQNDSLTSVDVVLTANYAIYYDKRDLWEAKGNVVVDKQDGKTILYTQQLFWNAKTKRIYSNVDSKLVTNNGRNVSLFASFESDEQFHNWIGRTQDTRMEVDIAPSNDRDTTVAATGMSSERRSSAMPRTSASQQNRGESTLSAPQVVLREHSVRLDAPSASNNGQAASTTHAKPMPIGLEQPHERIIEDLDNPYGAAKQDAE